MKRAPALLVNHREFARFLAKRSALEFRSWAFDPGQEAAHLEEVITVCKELIRRDPTLVEVFTLDVIGNWRAARANTDRMWDEGIPAIPVYHLGEPEQVLTDLASTFPKIALGAPGHLKPKAKLAWAQQCFARVWPARIHGIGFRDWESIVGAPFDSVDGLTWQQAEGLEVLARLHWLSQMAELDIASPRPPSVATSIDLLYGGVKSQARPDLEPPSPTLRVPLGLYTGSNQKESSLNNGKSDQTPTREAPGAAHRR